MYQHGILLSVNFSSPSNSLLFSSVLEDFFVYSSFLSFSLDCINLNWPAGLHHLDMLVLLVCWEQIISNHGAQQGHGNPLPALSPLLPLLNKHLCEHSPICLLNHLLDLFCPLFPNIHWYSDDETMFVIGCMRQSIKELHCPELCSLSPKDGLIVFT